MLLTGKGLLTYRLVTKRDLAIVVSLSEAIKVVFWGPQQSSIGCLAFVIRKYRMRDFRRQSYSLNKAVGASIESRKLLDI